MSSRTPLKSHDSLFVANYDVVEEKAESEPDFQYIPEKTPQDPAQVDQHALRDSMSVLREGLSSGAVLSQFDVRTRMKDRNEESFGVFL